MHLRNRKVSHSLSANREVTVIVRIWKSEMRVSALHKRATIQKTVWQELRFETKIWKQDTV